MQTAQKNNGPVENPLAELLDFGKPDERNIMLDIETLGTTAGSVILTVGAVAFDNAGVRERFYRRICLKDSLSYGFKVDADTLKWWLGQNEAVRNDTFDIGTNAADRVTTALDWMQSFFLAAGKKVVLWGNGASFDPVLIEAYFRKFDVSLPFDYRNVRCYRTVSAMFPMVNRRVRRHLHNAMADAEAQVERLLDIRGAIRSIALSPLPFAGINPPLCVSPESFAPRSANIANLSFPPQ